MTRRQGKKHDIDLVAILMIVFGSLPSLSFADMPFPEPNPPVEFRDLAETSLQLPKASTKSANVEWIYHKTEDDLHPNGIEQQQLWFVNRARSNPTAEGIWLAIESHADVAAGRTFFNVDIDKLQSEFAAIAVKPPAAFDRRLYEAAKAHSDDLIERDAQDHDGQLGLINEHGFFWNRVAGVVYSWTRTGLYAHAAFNIDWGNTDDGMQVGRGHRRALMSIDGPYTNVGIASVFVTDSEKEVGPYVTTGNYARANLTETQFNSFIVGTVWSDGNDNGWYDPGEGYGGVTVDPSIGTYLAVTSDSGGFSIPVTSTGPATITFSGGDLPLAMIRETILGAESILVDLLVDPQQPTQYTVTSSVEGNGDISPSTPQTVNGGAMTSFTITPDTNQHINMVTGCDGALSGNTYTTGPVIADCTVTANFAIDTHTVSPLAGNHGDISPSIPQTVNHSATTSFIITPDTNYHINTVTGCSGTLSGNTYTTGLVVADCVVTASFAIDTHPVIPSAGTNGSITPSIPQTINHGTTASFNINPDIGYHVGSITGTCNGTLSGNTFTTNPVTSNCTVKVVFALNTWTVTPFAEGDGSIAPPDPQTINHGSITTFTVTPDEGYTSFVGGTCGGVLDVTTYTTNTITSNCIVIANFGINMYLVNAPEGQHGTIAPYGEIFVNHSEILTFTLTPDDNYRIGDVSGCDGTLTENVYTTGDINGSCDITVTFAKDSFPWTMFLPAILSAQQHY